MESTQTEPGTPLTDAESSAQKQARIRRERREAKIKAGGSARLDRITNLSGRPVEPGSVILCTASMLKTNMVSRSEFNATILSIWLRH